MSVRRQILDPLSTLCKIASLSFYENGSRLSIIDNIVEVQKSDNKQWLLRKYRGDNKEHISLLYNPILKAIQWYVLQQLKRSVTPATSVIVSATPTIVPATILPSMITISSISPSIVHNKNDTINRMQPNEKIMEITTDIVNNINNDEFINQAEKSISDPENIQLKAIRNIMKFAILGLKELKDTYKEGNVTLALQFLIINLKMATRENPDLDLFEQYNDLTVFEEDSILNYDKIKGLWDVDTIKNISNQFTLCDKHRLDRSSLEYKLESLNSMLKDTDTKFKKLVVEMNAIL